ncbi:hydroxyisourate hydrolase [Pacificibacter sp. AS14]|uniref:hydroxyisourate hydrolase n=1 Tax=Pacificibacter sp. AS14 TaxID=3135785 RepID=UPI0031755DCE
MASGYLTTHVLDTALGLPACGLKIELFALQGDSRVKVIEMVTNDDGRTDSPILPKDDFQCGVYELLFHAGDYLRFQGTAQPEPFFLDIIPIRFGINDETSHYHVPLLLSPFGFSTYRGS